MSLLPQTIPSPSAALARVWKDGKPTEETSILEENWWLFLANLAIQVLGAGATSGLPATALIELGKVDSLASDADAIALRQPISNLRVQAGATGVDVDAAALRKPLSNALLLAQNRPLQDPVPRAQPVSNVVVGGSPYTYTTLFPGVVVITGGTVSSIALVRQGTSTATGLTAGVFPLSRLDQLVITHTGAPTATFLPT